MARHPDDVKRADRPVDDEVAGAREPSVESALEPHLELDPARRTCSTTSAVLARSIVIGFSQNVGSPASAQAWIRSA